MPPAKTTNTLFSALGELEHAASIENYAQIKAVFPRVYEHAAMLMKMPSVEQADRMTSKGTKSDNLFWDLRSAMGEVFFAKAYGGFGEIKDAYHELMEVTSTGREHIDPTS